MRAKPFLLTSKSNNFRLGIMGKILDPLKSAWVISLLVLWRTFSLWKLTDFWSNFFFIILSVWLLSVLFSWALQADWFLVCSQLIKPYHSYVQEQWRQPHFLTISKKNQQTPHTTKQLLSLTPNCSFFKSSLLLFWSDQNSGVKLSPGVPSVQWNADIQKETTRYFK